MLKIETLIKRLSPSDCKWISSFSAMPTCHDYDIALDQSLIARSQTSIIDTYHEDYELHMLQAMQMIDLEQSDANYFINSNSDSDSNMSA